MPNSTDDSWKGNGRPASMAARSFSAALDDAFSLNPELQDLSQSVAQRQQSVSTQKSELEHLEARLREMEARLKDRQPTCSSSSPPEPGPEDDRRGEDPQRPRPAHGGSFDTSSRNSSTRGRDTLRNHSDLDGNGNGMRHNGRSPLASAAVPEETRPPLRSNTSSDANIHGQSYDATAATPPVPSAPSNDLRHHSPPSGNLAPAARQENTPPQTSRNRQVRRKSFAATRQDKGGGGGGGGGGNGNMDANAASSRNKSRGKV